VFASVISKTNKTIIETDTLTLYFSIKFNYFYNQIINKILFVEKCKKNIAMALEITDATFEEIVLKSDKPVLVDFWAAWCGPCRMVGPIIDEVSDEYQGKAVVGKMDVDANQEFAAKYGVRNIPTVLVFNNGELVGRQVGVAQKSVYAEAIDSLL
jgi:thioredoxin 1